MAKSPKNKTATKFVAVFSCSDLQGLHIEICAIVSRLIV